MDYIGFGFVGLGLGCLQVVLDKGQREDWFASTFIIVFTVVSGVARLALGARDLTHKDPIVELPFRVSHGRRIRLAVFEMVPTDQQFGTH